MKIRIQPASFTDNMVDGLQMTKRPYPFIADEEGMVAGQDFWKGDPYQVIGFQRDLSVNRIDLRWQDAAQNPQDAVGMYLITADDQEDWWTHQTAVESMTVLPDQLSGRLSVSPSDPEGWS